MPALPIDSDQIVITASRAPDAEARTPASVTIIDKKRVERLGEPLVPALLRLSPSIAVATSGPAGSLTEVRIRGAEANHTLLFVDGIKINDRRGWAQVIPDPDEPLVHIYAEGQDERTSNELEEELRQLVEDVLQQEAEISS